MPDSTKIYLITNMMYDIFISKKTIL